MTIKPIDLTGQQFGRLAVLGYLGRDAGRAHTWLCRCQCGAEKSASSKALRSGESQSCGCLRKERAAAANSRRLLKHGETVGGNSRTYRIWANMISRCTNPKFDSYPYYGGRGIRVCERWRSFQAFFEDMGRAPEKCSLDRVDSNGDYSPLNCRWATKSTQANNTRHNVILEIGGVSKTVAQWARHPNAVNVKLIYARVANGWAHERAVFGAKR